MCSDARNDEIWERGEKLPIETALQASLPIASALDCAHLMGVVHRDIKPDNIIFNVENSSVKIADFGIARRSNPEIHEATQAGMILGTPHYMSPEQTRMLTDQAVGSGVALATFIASESAVPVLNEDWIGLESIADGAARRPTRA